MAQQQQLTPWRRKISLVHVVGRLLQHALQKFTLSPFGAAPWHFPLDISPIAAAACLRF
jgi:hypothetical protein